MRNIFGVSMDLLNDNYGLTQLANAGTSWTRLGLIWHDVENVEGARNWSASLDNQLIEASKRNMQVVLLLEGTPSWALKPGYTCGAVASNKFASMGNFLFDAVQRYSQAPYNIHYYELYNEPDVVGFLGCWGDQSDTQYFGGAYYGSMLTSVYARIKAADPQAQVLVGGLLLDCDPRMGGKTCTPSNFLSGILASGAGPYFDGVAFHAYDYYQFPGVYGNPNWYSSSTTTGPSLGVKAEFLRQVLTTYGYPNKYLISTESALFYGLASASNLCDPAAPPELEWSKAYYLVQNFTVAQAQNLRGNLWYTAIGPRCVSLFENNLTPKPAFMAYQFLRSRLQGAVFTQKITKYTGSLGYEFKRGNRIVWVIWSRDGVSRPAQLQNVPVDVQVIGTDGNPVAETPASSLYLTPAPRVIEFATQP